VYVTAYTIILNYQFFIIYNYASMNKTIRLKKVKVAQNASFSMFASGKMDTLSSPASIASKARPPGLQSGQG
jgi:hypothetical protein